jgi:hypothetical protein
MTKKYKTYQTVQLVKDGNCYNLIAEVVVLHRAESI